MLKKTLPRDRRKKKRGMQLNKSTFLINPVFFRHFHFKYLNLDYLCNFPRNIAVFHTNLSSYSWNVIIKEFGFLKNNCYFRLLYALI